MEKCFKDQRGKAKVIIEGDKAPLNMPEGGITLANRPKKSGSKMPDIGIRSNGFAGIATLAGLIAVFGAIIAFIALRY